ncbi:hypothetical protein ACFOLG_07885 [Vogesella facilis]|uniref:Uncharacterized protein n=1 Tax=Vogesella facilis TaxID=1655232 RepID=A0ABV7RHH8_9NEIS
MNWSEMPEFFEVDLTESFVLGWNISRDSVVFQLEVLLCQGHAMYHEPKPNEWACFHPGTLVFREVQMLAGLPDQSKVRPFIDAAGEYDYGHIDTLSWVGNAFGLSGDFGDVWITAKDVCLVLNPT